MTWASKWGVWDAPIGALSTKRRAAPDAIWNCTSFHQHRAAIAQKVEAALLNPPITLANQANYVQRRRISLVVTAPVI